MDSSATIENMAVGPFEGITVVFTGLPRKNIDKYYRELRQLGGKASDTVDDETSYLVVKRVGSEKHMKAQQRQIPCVQVGWIRDCIHQRTVLPVAAYLARAFDGCVITATQIDEEERKRIAALVRENGGTYSGDLRVDASSGHGPATTHLVARSRTGDKYLRASIERTIRIVNIGWIDACVTAKGWVPERDYPVTQGKEPLKLTARANSSTVVATTASPDTAAASATSSVANKEILYEDLPSITSMAVCNVFEGQVYYIHGYSRQVKDYITRLIIKGGGTRHPLLTAEVTVAVFEGTPANDSFIKVLKRFPFDVQVQPLEELISSYLSYYSTSNSSDESTSTSTTLQSTNHIATPITTTTTTTCMESSQQEESLGIGTQLQGFTAMLQAVISEDPPISSTNPVKPTVWGANKQNRVYRSSNPVKRLKPLSRQEIEGQHKTVLQQRNALLQNEPESQLVSFIIDDDGNI